MTSKTWNDRAFGSFMTLAENQDFMITADVQRDMGRNHFPYRGALTLTIQNEDLYDVHFIKRDFDTVDLDQAKALTLTMWREWLQQQLDTIGS